MTKRQAFFLSLAVGLAVLLPAYFAAAAVSLARGLPAGQAQSGVPILQPTADDRKTLLVMTGEASPQTFVLVRFDALENRAACVETPADTVVLCAGQPDTLAAASASAGPAQAAAALRETLKINVDNYLFCTPAQLAECRPRARGSFTPDRYVNLLRKMPPPRAGKFRKSCAGERRRSNAAPARGEVSLFPRGPLYNRLYIHQRYAIIEKTLKKAQRNHSRHGEVSFPPPRCRKTIRSGTKHSFSKSRTFHRDLE